MVVAQELQREQVTTFTRNVCDMTDVSGTKAEYEPQTEVWSRVGCGVLTERAGALYAAVVQCWGRGVSRTLVPPPPLRIGKK